MRVREKGGEKIDRKRERERERELRKAISVEGALKEREVNN